jgi:uncharacterized protein (TIRG00374 family)
VGVLISAILLWWTLRDVDFVELVGHVRALEVLPFAGCVIVATLGFPLRTVRWRYLLQLGDATLPFVPLWHATAIGFMANNLLPARAGEVARIYAAQKLTGVRFTAAAGSLVVERVMDGLTLVAFLALGIAVSDFDTTTVVLGVSFGRLLGGMGLVFVAVLAGAIWAVHWPSPALALSRWMIAHTLPARWADKALGLVEGLFDGLSALSDWRRFGIAGTLSVLFWATNAFSFYLCILAFDLPVPWSSAIILQSLIAFGVSVPSAPGFFGPFEAVTKATLLLYAVDATLATSYALAYHVFTFVPITLLGMWSLSRAHLHLADLGTKAAAASDE